MNKETEALLRAAPAMTRRPVSEAMESLLHVPQGALDHGFVRLVDYMGNESAITQAARVSYGAGTKTASDDAGLIRYLMRNRHCYTPEMEVLTSGGWRRWDECDYEETFMVPNPETRTYQFEKLQVEVFETDEEIQVFSNDRMSYRVTGEHRMWFKGKYREKFGIVRASEMPRWGHFDPAAGYHVPGDGIAQPLGKLVGFVLGDGSWSGNGLTFHLRKQRKKAYLRQCLSDLGICATESKSGTYDDAVVFYIKVDDVRRIGLLEHIEPGCRAADKRLKSRHDDSATLRGIFDGLVNSDGHINESRGGRIEFSSVSSELASLFEQLATWFGYDAHRVAGDAMVYCVYAYPPGRTTLEARKEHFRIEHYRGKVYCATTSTGLLMVRGGPDKFGFVCGNSTPFEMCEVKLHVKLPIFVARQWIRHRTACLSGATALHFDLPGGVERRGSQLYKLSVKEVFDRFQPTENTQRPDKQGNPRHKRDRVQSMLLRSVNEETGEVHHTNVVDIWESGEKEVFHVKLSDGTWFECSKDHLIFTDNGWFKLEELDKGHRVIVAGPGRGTGVSPHLREADEGLESWRPIPGWEAYYEVSDHGRVRRIAGGRGSRRGIKKNTISNGRAVVSLNRPGEQATALVHRLVMEAFIGPCPDGMECCHNDGNSLNNWLDNLRWDTPQANANDRVRDGATTALCSVGVPIVSVVSIGVEMTYDLEVAGPWHNFSAGGAIVHNSVNEVSARYSILAQEFYVPDPGALAEQSKSNKQGRQGELTEHQAGYILALIKQEAQHQYQVYGELLNDDGSGLPLDDSQPMLARELARMGLGLNYYTEWYWKIDLHNLLHFLSLRMDSHAQHEIRVYADIIGGMVESWMPAVWHAFEEYRLHAHTFSRAEMDLLVSLLDQGNIREQIEASGGKRAIAEAAGISSSRERQAFWHALKIV